MFFVHAHEDEEPLRAEADELPWAHAALRLELRSYRDLPMRLRRDRRRSTVTSAAERCTG